MKNSNKHIDYEKCRGKRNTFEMFCKLIDKKIQMILHFCSSLFTSIYKKSKHLITMHRLIHHDLLTKGSNCMTKLLLQ
jgi:hypothetical protein